MSNIFKGKYVVLCILYFYIFGLSFYYCGKTQVAKTGAGEAFNFTLFYTEGISDVNCFSTQIIEIKEGNNPTPVFSGYFKTKIGEEKSVKIQSIKVMNSSDGRMIEEGSGTVEIFQDKISISISTPFPPQRFSYFEIRGFRLDAGQSCEEVYDLFYSSGVYESIYAIGRTLIIDPKQERKTIGILSLVGAPDTFQTIITTARAFPMAIEFFRDDKTKFRKFLLCGGIDERSKSVLRTCDILDEESMTLQQGPVMNFPRVFGSIAKSFDGKVSVSGGFERNARIVPFFETYDPENGIFLKIKRVIPRFSHFLFSTENNIGILGGVNSDGIWEKQIEVLPYSQSDEKKSIKLLYFLEDSGKFGSCFAEDQANVYITGGINSSPRVIILKKERIDVGTLEVKLNKITSAKLVYSNSITTLTRYGKLSFPFSIKSLSESEIKFGNCKMVSFENLLIIATSYGEIYFVVLSKDDIIDAFPDDPSVDIFGVKIPPSSDDFPNSVRKSKKGFSFEKVSEDKAVLFGGYDYVSFLDTKAKTIVPSDEVLLISKNREIFRYKTKFHRKGAFSFLFGDEFLIIVGGNPDGRAEVIFVGKLEYPEKIDKGIISGQEEQKEEEEK